MHPATLGRTLGPLCLLGLTLVLVPSATACSGNQAPPPTVDGRMASGGGTLGDWDIYPNRCTRKGDEVVLDREGDSRRKVKLVDRSRGTSSTLSKVEIRLDDQNPDGTSLEIVLTDATCVTGSFEAEGKGRIGNLKIDCTTGEGGHVVGALQFANCL
jgi:hypothetical protein